MALSDQLVAAFTQNFPMYLSQLDRNRDGAVDFNELVQFIMQNGYGIQEAQQIAAQVFQKLDRNQDGRLTYEDIMGII